MKTVYKYPLPFAEIAKLELPKGAEIIRIDNVEGFLYLWAVVDNEVETEVRTFYLQKTGAPFPSEIEGVPLRYLGYGAIFIQMEICLYAFERI